jgi:hypothetical protein
LVTAVSGPSFLVVLASGVYLAKSLGAWHLGWVRVALPTLVVVAIAGSVGRSSRQRLRSAITASSGPLLPDLLAELRKPLLVQSLRLRTALLVGLVFVMTVRPDDSVGLGMLGVASLGALWGLAAGAGPARGELVILTGDSRSTRSQENP